MLEFVREALELAALGVGAVGAAVLVWGVAIAVVVLLRAELCRFRGDDPGPAQRQLRHVLGMYLLLGLEILVAADIIETLVAPTLEHLAILGAIVLIRTIISFTLNLELKHSAAPGAHPPDKAD